MHDDALALLIYWWRFLGGDVELTRSYNTDHDSYSLRERASQVKLESTCLLYYISTLYI